MTLAEYRGIRKRPKEEGEVVAPAETRGVAHPGVPEYVKVGVALAVVTAIEVAVFYADLAQWALVVVLVVLSTVKFSLVVMWFMHLRFDNRLFSGFFVGGLVLAAALFAVVLATLGGGLF